MSDAWARLVASLTISSRADMERLDLAALDALPEERRADAIALLVGQLRRGDLRAPEALLRLGAAGREALAANETASADAATRSTAWDELARCHSSEGEARFLAVLFGLSEIGQIASALSAFLSARQLMPLRSPPSALATMPNRLASSCTPVRIEAQAELREIACKWRDGTWSPDVLMPSVPDPALLDSFRAAVFDRPERIDLTWLPHASPAVRRWAEDVLLCRLDRDARVTEAAGRVGGPRLAAALEDVARWTKGVVGEAAAAAAAAAKDARAR